MKSTIFMVIAVFGTVLYMAHYALSLPEVHFSYSTKQCVKIVDADGNAHSCKHMPKKFYHIWVK